MSVREYFKVHPKRAASFFGITFLSLYWLFAFDGITFSDDVYYLLAGKKFWEGSMEFNDYHFSTRWGAYVPSGLVGFLFGFDPHRISLISLISYIGTLGMLLKVLPKEFNPWVLVIWFSIQVYFLHFLTKVYPDSLLVFWTVLVPFSAIYRSQKPYLAALGVISGLFFGFITKETIIFLAPLPILLFVFDWKKGNRNLAFYYTLVGLGLAFGAIYLGYFWIKFGSPFYRFESIQDGHYISEFTYADKSAWVMLQRLTVLPIITFVERSYWLWIVFAIPGLHRIWRKTSSPGIEFGLAFLSMLGLFWFMSTNFRFYNPLYLNPRHLIIMVPILAFLIATGWEEWRGDLKLKLTIIGLILLGVAISLIQQDWKIAAFQAFAIVIIYVFHGEKLVWTIGIYLLIPALIAISYQQKIKGYNLLIQTLSQETSNADNQSLILTNNFIDFSKEVLFSENQSARDLLFPIEKLDSLKLNPPQNFRVLIYDYYKHSYPKEQVDVDALELWLKDQKLLIENREGLIWIRNFEFEKNK
ncbi:hypothetical protein [Algoriphagus sp.]|uniref:hypothetical protein n=1 Tax=Algoriphagus sp. TaxID=1872435 RepID=UPI003919FA24